MPAGGAWGTGRSTSTIPHSTDAVSMSQATMPEARETIPPGSGRSCGAPFGDAAVSQSRTFYGASVEGHRDAVESVPGRGSRARARCRRAARRWRAPRPPTPPARSRSRRRGRSSRRSACAGRWRGDGGCRPAATCATACSTWRRRRRSSASVVSRPRWVERVFDGDVPPVGRGRRAGGGEIAADADQRAAGAAARSSVTTMSAARPLPIPPGSRPSAGGHDHRGRRGIDRHVGDRVPDGAIAEASGSSLPGPVDARRVAGGDDRGEHRRVVATVRHAPRLLHRSRAATIVSGDTSIRASRRGVQPRDVAVRQKPAPAPFQLLETAPGVVPRRPRPGRPGSPARRWP